MAGKKGNPHKGKEKNMGPNQEELADLLANTPTEKPAEKAPAPSPEGEKTTTKNPETAKTEFSTNLDSAFNALVETAPNPEITPTPAETAQLENIDNDAKGTIADTEDKIEKISEDALERLIREFNSSFNSSDDKKNEPDIPPLSQEELDRLIRGSDPEKPTLSEEEIASMLNLEPSTPATEATPASPEPAPTPATQEEGKPTEPISGDQPEISEPEPTPSDAEKPKETPTPTEAETASPVPDSPDTTPPEATDTTPTSEQPPITLDEELPDWLPRPDDNDKSPLIDFSNYSYRRKEARPTRTTETAPQWEKIPAVDTAYWEFTKKENILSEFISQKADFLSDKLDRVIGNNDARYGKSYGLLDRSLVRLKNIFDTKLFNSRNNKVMKLEEKVMASQQEILQQTEMIEVYQEVISDISRPAKERIRAQKSLAKAQKELISLNYSQQKKVSNLSKFENLKEKCHHRIAERTGNVVETINERISPYQEKIKDGETVLNSLKTEMDKAGQEFIDWNKRLMEFQAQYSEARGSDRAALKVSLRRVKRAVKDRENLMKEIENKIDTCQDRINHLQDRLNPWNDLAQTYEQMAETPVYQSPIQKKEYRPSTASDRYSRYRPSAESYQSRPEIIQDDTVVEVDSYLKEFNSLREMDRRSPWAEIDLDKLQDKLLAYTEEDSSERIKELKIKELEDAVAGYFRGQGEDEKKIRDFLETVRASLSIKI